VTLEASAQHILIMDLSGHEVRRKRLRFPNLRDAAGSMQWLAGEIERQIVASGIARSRVLGVGVTPVGVVDPLGGIVIDSPIPGWRQVEVGTPLRAALGLPVRVDGMLNALTLAEHAHGLSRDRKDVVLVHTTLGIGSSLLADGRVVRGFGMRAGQIAHARVAGSNQPCICGRRGCLAALASGHAVLASLGYPASPEPNLEERLVALTDVLERATRGDEPAVTSVHAAGRALGRFMGASMTLAAPELLLLGGRLGSHESYVRGVQQGLKECQPADSASPDVRITSMSGDEAAAHMAVEDLVFAGPLGIAPLMASGPAPAQSRPRAGP
jgi:predicted NBD/HSP70 family sugar kinase